MAGPNDELVALFRELVQLTTLDEGGPGSFRVRAYENAMHELKAHRGDLSALTEKELTKLDGIGKSTAKKIREFFERGSITKIEELRRKFPPAFVQLSGIPGLGPKTLLRLRDELGVHNVSDLRAAIESKSIRELKGLGEKSEQKLSRAIERMGLTGKDKRTPIADALPVAERLVAKLEAMPEVAAARYCGSLRRFRETIGDIDIVVASADAAPIMERFVSMPLVQEVIGHGDTKSSIVTTGGLQVDLRVVESGQFGAATLYFTGSKAHNIKLRQRAIERGWTLNEYALSDAATGKVIAAATERDIYDALGLPTIPEPMREDTGEIERAADGTLPPPVTASDLRGDVHVHTSLSGDGHSSLEDTVAAAAELGWEYLVITDHGETLAINGVSREQLRTQRDEIAALCDRFPQVAVLQGVELNIGPAGEVDYDAAFRRELDFCIAGVHSHFDLEPAQQTARVLAAMEDPTVRAIAHPTARLIGRRPGLDFDIDAVLAKAVETDTAIEINAALSRLDATDDMLLRARDLGVTFVIGSDAHRAADLERLCWGAVHATRGWVDVAAVANSWPRDKFLAWARRS